MAAAGAHILTARGSSATTISATLPIFLIFLFSVELLFPLTVSSASAYTARPVVPSPAGSVTRSFYLNNHPRHHTLPPPSTLATSARYEGSSDLIKLRYHMGPVLSSPLSLYILWYGQWNTTHKSTIRDFLLSVSDTTVPPPSISQWWSSTAALYTDQTGANITRRITVASEATLDPSRSQGTSLTRLTVQNVLSDAIRLRLLPVDHKSGAYLLLTSQDVTVQDFCRAVCGFHYFTFPSIVGHTLPYAWVGNSGRQCPETCAYPFAVPGYMGGKQDAMVPPNGDVGVDGMVSVVGHELAELASNPLVNAWYAGEDPTAPTEIADLCEGVYGSGGGGGYTGEVSTDGDGRKFNLNGRNGRRFLVQWIWSPVLKACAGPNAID